MKVYTFHIGDGGESDPKSGLQYNQDLERYCYSDDL